MKLEELISLRASDLPSAEEEGRQFSQKHMEPDRTRSHSELQFSQDEIELLFARIEELEHYVRALTTERNQLEVSLHQALFQNEELQKKLGEVKKVIAGMVLLQQV